VKISPQQHQCVWLALFFWLLVSWSGAHGHLCFDGLEPPISYHLDMIGDHPEHDSAEQHQDVDVDLQQLMLAKLSKIDLPLALLAAAFVLLFWGLHRFVPLAYLTPRTSHARRWRPPLRGPPVTPA
jgi:hypothetical protein